MPVLKFQTDPIAFDAVADEPLTVTHGFGRPVNGWIVIYAEAPVSLHALENTPQRLVLVPSASTRIKVVLV